MNKLLNRTTVITHRVRARLEAACTAGGRDPATQALEIPPESFVRTAPTYDPNAPRPRVGGSLTLQGSPQTDALLALLELGHRVTMPYQPRAGALEQVGPAPTEGGPLFFLDHGGGGAAPVVQSSSGDPNAIDIDLDEEEEEGGEGGNGGREKDEEGGDTIVFAGEAAAATTGGPSKSRPKLVLPPPSSST